MFDTIKKSMLTGIGLALKTRDEVEDFAKDWTASERGRGPEIHGRPPEAL